MVQSNCHVQLKNSDTSHIDTSISHAPCSVNNNDIIVTVVIWLHNTYCFCLIEAWMICTHNWIDFVIHQVYVNSQALMYFLLVAGDVVLTSTMEESGRQFACDGEMVTFTCQVFKSIFLKWKSPLIRQTPIVFVSGFTVPVSTSRPPFIASLTSIAGIGLSTNFTSTLQVNASRTFARNHTTVECRNQRHVTEELKFTVTGTCNMFTSHQTFFFSLLP